MTRTVGWFVVAVVLAGLAGGAARAESPVVVELFTSQGCSSCPPADRLAGELSQRDDVLVLSYNVDYWDYIGWKDTLARPENSARQKAYAQSHGRRSVYTPQMIVGGRVGLVGSNRAAVLGAIEQAADMGLELKMLRDHGDNIRVHLPEAAGRQRSADVLLVRFDDSHKIDIGAGENSGRMITYFNVVRDFTHIGTWAGEAKEITLRMSVLRDGGRDNCAVIVQEPGQGRILGSAQVRLSAQ